MSQNEWKNEKVAVTLTREPACRVKFEVTITPEESKNIFQQAIKNINKEVSIPGFRKGKAPSNVIMQRYGTYIDSEWRDLLARNAYRQAMTLSKVYPLNEEARPKANITKASQEEGSLVTLEFETLPEIPTVTSDMELKSVKRSDIKPDDIEGEIERLRLYSGKWKDINDRAVQENDYIDVDIRNLDNNESEICADTRFHVKEGVMAPWMYKLVLGATKGQQVEGVSEKSEKQEDDKPFTPTRCLIHINQIWEAELPEINDEFAKKYGQPNVEELKKVAESRLNQEADEEVRRELSKQVEDILNERYQFDLPESYVEAEMQHRLQSMAEQMFEKGNVEADIRRNLEKVKSQIKEEVIKDLRIFYLLMKFTEDNKIQITNEDFQKEVQRSPLLMMELQSKNEAEKQLANKRILFRIMTRKAKDYLISHAKIVNG